MGVYRTFSVRMLLLSVSFEAYLRDEVLCFKANNELIQCQKTPTLPSMPVARFPTSGWVPWCLSRVRCLFLFSRNENARFFVFFFLRACEQLRSFSIGGQLLQLNHRMVLVQEDQENICQIRFLL